MTLSQPQLCQFHEENYLGRGITHMLRYVLLYAAAACIATTYPIEVFPCSAENSIENMIDF